tara:strand:- start:8036 stop:8248 length:213 start_codon:yes stop_codon:yes gene_type:complete
VLKTVSQFTEKRGCKVLSNLKKLNSDNAISNPALSAIGINFLGCPLSESDSYVLKVWPCAVIMKNTLEAE